MRILMTADAVGGVWGYALELARGLERFGVEVTLATMGPRPTASHLAEARGCRNLRLVEGDYRLEWMQEPWDDVAAAGRWLLELEAEHRPDVIHVNGYAHAALPFRAPVLAVAHSCVCSWWRAVHHCEAPADRDRYRAAVLQGLHAATAVVAPTAALMAEMTTLYGAPRAGHVIPNGRDLETLPLGTRDAFGRYSRLATRPEALVLAAGRLWDPAKNMETLARAAGGMAWPLYVAGSAAAPDGGHRQLHGVHHLGTLTPAAMTHWHRRASIFVHPALYEPFGLAPLEAAMGRTALVLADIPTLREVWGDAALFVPPRDPAAIAGAVNRLIATPLLLDRMAEAAAARARDYTGRRMAHRYNALYRSLAGRAPRTSSPEAVACAS
jgi:glycogen synthase